MRSCSSECQLHGELRQFSVEMESVAKVPVLEKQLRLTGSWRQIMMRCDYHLSIL